MLDVSTFISQAKEATGLCDFGEDGWQEGLEVLTASANRDARLNDTGHGAFASLAVTLLTRRLEVEDCFHRHPEIEEQEIIAPLMVLGLPRTGSTALHHLLSADPAVRVIRHWESLTPCPPPELATQHNDPRIAATEEQMQLRDRFMPRMKQMLPMTATSPIEDQFIMGHDFKSQVFLSSFRIPGYQEWLDRKADLVPTFRYVKRVLKLLQWRCPPTKWRLKNPTYSQFISALDTVFPDARYCMTHRDVEDVIPSVADLYFELGHVNTDSPDRLWMGEVATSNCKNGMREMIRFRDAGNDHRFLDMHFIPLQKTPLPELERLYAFLDEELTDEAKARMMEWRAATPRDKHGRHEYDPADYGLDRQALRKHMDFYYGRFASVSAH